MPEKPNRPPLKWLLLSSLGIVLLGMAPVVWYVSLPDDFHAGRELQARGFIVCYGTFWRHPIYVHAHSLDITPEDCRLISRLTRVSGLYFYGGDVSELNLDAIGNCRELWSVSFDNVTRFPVNELRKLAACQIVHINLNNIDLKDSDLEILTELPALRILNLQGNAGINDAGLECLEKFSSLKSLYLQKTSVTQEGVAKFQKKRPDIEIVYIN